MSFIALCAVFWMLLFSVAIYKLAYGSEKGKEEYKKVVVPFLILAWLNIIGVPPYDWLRAWLFGGAMHY